MNCNAKARVAQTSGLPYRRFPTCLRRDSGSDASNRERPADRELGGTAAKMSVLLFPARQQHGFTLIEMLTVIGIVLILMAIAIPALKSFQSTALQVGARQVSSAMQLARQYAINNRLPVRFVIAVDRTSGVLRDDLVLPCLHDLRRHQ
jgi:prepilin-type N-terminal cleavage/methylation domain-containing protein